MEPVDFRPAPLVAPRGGDRRDRRMNNRGDYKSNKVGFIASIRFYNCCFSEAGRPGLQPYRRFPNTLNTNLVPIQLDIGNYLTFGLMKEPRQLLAVPLIFRPQ